jgi:hypothetical protein
MANKSTLKKLFDFILPPKSNKSGGNSYTDTYDPSNTTQTLTLPEYQQHLSDIAETRLSENSQELIKQMMVSDPDTSAAVSAYLTLADTQLTWVVRDSSGAVSRDGQKLLESLLYKVFEITDYTLKYQSKPSMSQFLSELRYMLLMRGAIGVELVYDKALQPYELRNVDMGTIEFKESKPGQYKPFQTTENVEELSLDIPTFFTERFKQDPSDIYNYSYFTSAINTVAARAVVINDLYRIMRITGYPRITLEVVEEILKKRAPKAVQEDSKKYNEWVNQQLNYIANRFSDIRSDLPFAFTNSVKVGILNDKNPGASLQVADIINTLNAQNQAGLKVVSTILGRGESGVNTASVEARIFSLSADALNKPIASILSRAFTLALRIAGFDGFVTFKFTPSELKPELELESQKIQKQTRLMKDLSLGIITDETYCMEMYGTIPPEGMQPLSGTRFLEPSSDESVDTTIRKENSIDRATIPDGANGGNSNEMDQV